ncbi:MAG: hypothetical protein EAZ74_06115 [Alphaproteobacteria bacterium]|nr:MAG: hypothetical protein EAY76_05835 [Alphaproteobacteria bacterium]TAF13275.1 MAG: hypothetical protein EAZ74_06115 [Alphaproteobacteria bacterium]TAF38302.1 MAG: hypothetical protein EAZ66_06595 [Alphaproteobacteria bacterium]TAF77326.1 MAG: hypothetical protein EAZ52_00820 [Alphaproteobacteria bacterium]
MELYRDDESCTWHFQKEDADAEAMKNSHFSYFEALPKYLNSFEPVFAKAKKECEFGFICSLLRIKSEFTAENCDPFQTTSDSIAEILNLIKANPYSLATEHLWLWLYGHIVEASAPYELLYNLISVASDGSHNIYNFGYNKNGQPLMLHNILDKLRNHSNKNNFSDAMRPIDEVYNKDLRNAIFHSDYSIADDGTFITREPYKKYYHDEKLTFVNKALAYLESLRILRQMHISSYKFPKYIAVPKHWENQNEQAVTIIRDGYGVVGLKNTWSRTQIKNGAVGWHVANVTEKESLLLRKNAHRKLFILPNREVKQI